MSSYQAYNCCTCAPGYVMNQDKECVPSEFRIVAEAYNILYIEIRVAIGG